jgi:hypothetical protein
MNLSNFKARTYTSKYLGGCVAQATDEQGEVICFVYYQQFGDVLHVTDFSVNPLATPDEAEFAGTAVEILLAKQARAAGIRTPMWLLPGADRCEPLLKTSSRTQTAPMVGCYQTPSARYLN